MEKELAEIGRLKPFHASTFVSYLLWAEKYSVDLEVYISSFEISECSFKSMFDYEKIPEEKRLFMKKEAINFVSSVVSRYKNKLQILKGRPINLIDMLLSDGFRVAFNVACKFPFHDKLLGHARVCVRKENNKYIILDSYFGKLVYTREEMIRDLDNVAKIGGTYGVVAYKK